MTKHRYSLALACYLAIPAVLIAGAGLFTLIDPEMARNHADYVRDYRLLNLVRMAVLIITAGLAVVLWLSCCYLVIQARQRSLRWLLLAAAGPFGFIIIAMLGDRSPVPGDLYQQFIRNLKIYWRVPLEIVVFALAWFCSFAGVALLRELMIRYEAFTTGTPMATIIARLDASSGMSAFSDGLEVTYLVVLIYLLWPIFFNFAGGLLKQKTTHGFVESSGG